MNEVNGAIYDVIKDGEKIKEDGGKNKILKFKKTFVNYFSLGFDARVGFQFEQRRTSYRCCNKVVYACEGAKRIFCCKKNYGLTQLLDGFLEGNNKNKININNNTNDSDEDNRLMEKSSDSDIEEVPNESLPTINDKITSDDNDKRFVFKTKKSGQKDIVIKGNPVSLICQNIDFYMGGTRDIWGKTSISKNKHLMINKLNFLLLIMDLNLDWKDSQEDWLKEYIKVLDLFFWNLKKNLMILKELL